MITDLKKPTDLVKPTKIKDVVDKARKQAEKLTKQLEQDGPAKLPISPAGEKITALAEGPVSPGDWMKMEAGRFSPVTKISLEGQGLTPEVVLNNPDKAEDYAGAVFKMEGIPNGNGGVDKVQGVAAGHYDEAGHGLDLVAVDDRGTPAPIEVKKYNQPSSAHMEDRQVVKLEPQVEQWRQQRENEVFAKQTDTLTDIRPDPKAEWKPEVKAWKQQLDWNEMRMKQHEGRLPVQQMDDLWTQDRWLKIIKNPEGQQRIRQIGVDKKFLDYRHMSSSPDLPEWKAILDHRSAVIVSGSKGDVGKRLFNQAIQEGRVKSVIKIEV